MAAKAKISEEDIKDIIELYQVKNVSTVEIGKKYHMDKRRVKSILEENGIHVGKSPVLSEDDIKNIVKMYTEDCIGVHDIGKHYHVSHLKITKLLNENGIEVGNRGTAIKDIEYPTDIFDPNKNYIARHKQTGKEFNDYMNVSGALIRYLEEVNPDIEIPSKWLRAAYLKLNRIYWHQQYFDIIEIKKPVQKTNEEIKKEKESLVAQIIKLYTKENVSTHKIGEKLHLGHRKVKQILEENGIKVERKVVVGDGKLPDQLKYEDGKNYVAIHKETAKKFDDPLNKSGHLTSYLLELNPNLGVPSSFKRRAYYLKTGKYWHEQFFDIVEEEIVPVEVKKCKYCDWSTVDIENKSGMYKTHLLKEHNKTIDEYLREFPDEYDYFQKDKRIKDFEQNEDAWIECAICGEKLKRIDWKHLDNHNITLEEYKIKFGFNTVSNKSHDKLIECGIKANIALSGKDNHYVSSQELMIREFLTNYNIEYKQSDREILNAKEIDIVIEDAKLGIEFNGCKWHSEFYGKKYKKYHLEKTIGALEKGYSLIQIFEDELYNNEFLVFDKLKRILNIGLDDKINIDGKKCDIKEINSDIFNVFINKYDLEGGCECNKYLGLYYFNKLISVCGVSLIDKKEKSWNIDRLAIDTNYICDNMLNKYIRYMRNNYNINFLETVCDRRWIGYEYNNIFTNNGFQLIEIIEPDYTYYIEKINKHKRLDKRYIEDNYPNIDPLNNESISDFKFDKIWDCGCLKYRYNLNK